MKLVPMRQASRDAVEYYWQCLAMHDRLASRFFEIKDPQWQEVKRYLQLYGNNMMFVLDTRDEIIAEFTLVQLQGRMYQVHFSMHPELTFKDAVRVANDTTNLILATKMVNSLFGITPVTNRPALHLAMRIGFKRRTKVSDAVYIAAVDEWVPAVITEKRG